MPKGPKKCALQGEEMGVSGALPGVDFISIANPTVRDTGDRLFQKF